MSTTPKRDTEAFLRSIEAEHGLSLIRSALLRQKGAYVQILADTGGSYPVGEVEAYLARRETEIDQAAAKTEKRRFLIVAWLAFGGLVVSVISVFTTTILNSG